ncbi:ribosome small subunit-dependent GTPase A [Calidifontibacillus oryziterrae]|uniref:ribosome small subunit-dependent GTPase A n=1 Tax=Calidifontibacillus oryziterrae TaxID=1191699 RepID=UPI00030EB758|nr:ribosome small subunit-dependent GTPase A [Calidifontibacillus oryziterrae]
MTEGKIIKALSGFYYVLADNRITQCRGRGVFRKKGITPLVGDYVIFEAENDHEGYILEIKPRKNELLRPPISNVDQAILVFSAVEPDFNPLLLDRFLVQIELNHITPVICITKMDIVNGEQLDIMKGYGADYSKIGYDVVFTSAKTQDGIEKLRPYLDGKISVFAGQSGVGKSSLLNSLNPELLLKTDNISNHLGRGKHTTRHVELIQFESGLVADTPGFSSLDFINIELDQLSSYFPEMAELSDLCKFRGCLHIAEPKCEVKKAVEQGEIPKYRYDHYLQFMEEIKERKPRY